MITQTERHQFILNKLSKESFVNVLELCKELDVSSVTIRKDLKLLEEKNLLFRTKGGGSINNPYAAERTINEKEFINADQKKKIAKAALNLLGQNDSIIIGSGTTVFELAQALYPPKHITVITPALRVALELCNRPNVDILQIGGLIHHSSASAAGAFGERLLEDISCGLLFMGVDGIEPEFGLSITNLAEASLDKKMISVAQQVVVMADSTKFGRRGIGRICGLDQVDYIITDAGAPMESIRQLEEKGVKTIIAE